MKLLVIDGNSLVNRAFYGIALLSNKEGTPTNAIYGFLTMMNKILREEEPEAFCITFDLKAPTFRHKAYPDYKGHRRKMPEELAIQLPLLKEVLQAMAIPCYALEGWEADDLIGTIARITGEQGGHTVIVTGDKDALQLICDHTTVNLVLTTQGKTTTRKMTSALFEEEFGFPPIHLVDFKALIGDSSDNIPGIRGVGEKTALPLIGSYLTIDAIFSKLQADPEESLGLRPMMLNRVREGEESARLSYDLATIRTNAPLDFCPDDALRAAPNEEELSKLLSKLELFKILDAYELDPTVPEEVPPLWTTEEGVRITSLSHFQELVQKWSGKLAFLPLDNDSGIALTWVDGNKAYPYYLHEFFTSDYDTVVKELFTCDLALVGIATKEFQVKLLRRGISATNITFDVEVAGYLLAPEAKGYSLESLALQYCQTSLPSGEVFHGAEAFTPLEINPELLALWSKHCLLLMELEEVLSKELFDLELYSLYEELEHPLCAVLAQMQYEGISVNRKALEDYGKKVLLRLEEVEQAVYQEAGETFNLNSPKQLGVILFEKLELPPVKKTKTGYSTSAEVLEKLRTTHPDCAILPMILEQRHLSKLHTTYVKGLTKVLTPEDKIHTHFQNTVTATGRLSSMEPNLQNIPIRTPLGAELRDMFIAAEGCVLIDADYSQIELRLLAHMAQDESMLQAFRDGVDIHSQTASQVFHIPLEEVTNEMRRSAKAVNFGIVYGMSAFALAEDLSVSQGEAKDYINRYFKTYPKVKEYLDQVVTQARESGYACTLFGRKRWIGELNSTNFQIRGFGERMAQNSPIQGTAADIIKKAMLAVATRLQEQGLDGKLVLQVHDELIIQCPKDQGEVTATLVQEAMEQVADLSVPLLAETHIGKHWGEAH